jgi:hypothetical protein
MRDNEVTLGFVDLLKLLEEGLKSPGKIAAILNTADAPSLDAADILCGG